MFLNLHKAESATIIDTVKATSTHRYQQCKRSWDRTQFLPTDKRPTLKEEILAKIVF